MVAVPNVKNLKFLKSKMAAAAILKIENRPYLRIGSTDLCELRYDDAQFASDSDRKLKFPPFKNSRWRTAAILKIGKQAIEEYVIMRRLVPVKSAIHRVSISRIISYVIYFTYFTYKTAKIIKRKTGFSFSLL